MNENETEVTVETPDTTPEVEEVTTEKVEETPEVVEKPKETLEQRQARLTRELKQVNKKLGIEEEKPVEKKAEKTEKTGELEELQLDYFELKGITDEAKLDVIQKVMQRTSLNHRQVLKDEYVIAKLEAIDKAEQVAKATPSSTRRSGASVANDVDFWLAKFDKDGTLPDDFELRSKVINKRVEKDNTNKPRWHK